MLDQGLPLPLVVYLSRVIEDRLERAPLADQGDRTLHPDSWYPGNVVDGIAHQTQDIGYLLRRHAKLLCHHGRVLRGRWAMGLVFRIESMPKVRTPRIEYHRGALGSLLRQDFAENGRKTIGGIGRNALPR